MFERLKNIESRFDEVADLLTQPDVLSDNKRMAQLSKEYKDLEKIVKASHAYQRTKEQLESARDVFQNEEDQDFRELAREEMNELEPKLEQLEEDLKQLLVPKDPEDSMNVIMEIRAGAGGDEAALFAGDLFRMYERYCESMGWKLSVTDVNEGTSGGFKEIVASIEGEDAFGSLKYESGVHRVQRVPETETQGRVHTSAASVVMMPEPEAFEFELQEKDLRIDRFCASGNGGQSVNTTYSAVRLTHIPTGTVVSMQNERSQIKNLALAKKIMTARIYELEMKKRQSEADATRRSIVSTGDRSAKIRTYNFPQSRVTDHRINKTEHNLSQVLDGPGLGGFLEALRLADNAAKLAGEEQL
ncbi:MAG: peptide chain release factor 1, partial [Bacteroidota bacterium]